MSIFQESLWETDETGDKLAKEFFLSKKKVKPAKKTKANDAQNRKKFKENGRKTSQISQSEDNGNRTDTPAFQDKTNHKKRKSSSVAIDENMIKKWKSESIAEAAAKQGTKLFRKEIKGKMPKLADKQSTKNEKEATGNEAAINKKKKKRSESRDETEKIERKKKANASFPEGDTNAVNLVTKSQKRRLKQKEKLLKSKESLTRNKEESIEAKRECAKGLSHADDSRDPKASKITNKSKLKLDRIQRLLDRREHGNSKSNGNSAEPKSLRERMMSRLKSSRFRYLNEQMYNNESWASKKYFKEDPDAFLAYHEGYKLQVEQWPLNPLDTIIASVKRLPKDYVVADFGCGEARLAESVPQKVNSLDLVAINDKVTACDMAHTSLLSGRIDVVIFCLSLMGTNLTDYLIEANRVLRKDGILKIAEVESRFEDVDEFVKTLASYGFVNTWKDFSHNLFYFMDFKKDADITKKRNKLPPLELKSCLYKRR